MRIVNASEYSYDVILSNSVEKRIFPLFRDDNGQERMLLVSAQHGRSYVVGKNDDGSYIVSKGNGLSYTSQSYLTTEEQISNVWGLLREKDAVRDFHLGCEIADIGILTNKMEYVIRLDLPLNVKGNILHPVLLQYTVECPYRISDSAFIQKKDYLRFIEAWSDKFNLNPDLPYHLQAAQVLISNLAKLHAKGVLHNAISSQNYTWALELLDFELSCSPSFPYDNEDSQRYHFNLFSREYLYVYQIIMDIAGILNEQVVYKNIEKIFNQCFNQLGVFNQIT